VRAKSLSHANLLELLFTALALSCTACIDSSDSVRITNGPNQSPLGVIDEPRDGATVQSSFRVRGWAGDDRGIRGVRVFIDGDLAAVAAFTWDRPDVTNVHPHFRHGNDRHGWETIVDSVVPGPHAVHVEAIDTDGATSDLGTVRVIVDAR
jgi:hypothetical protein